MTDKDQQALQDIARRQLILSHRVAVWYTLVQNDPHSDQAEAAAKLAELEARELLTSVQEATDIEG